jgi:hypothetical protein
MDWHLHRLLSARFSGDMKVSGDDASTYTGLRLSAGVVFNTGR